MVGVRVTSVLTQSNSKGRVHGVSAGVWLPASPTYRSFGPRQVSVEALLDAKEGEPYNEWIAEVRRGLQIHPPELCDEGLSGTYFLRNPEGDIIAIFKPRDEEGASLKNPKNFSPEGLFECPLSRNKQGILPGEGAQREVAAYLLDKRTGFSGVPKTVMVALHHPCFDNNTVHSSEHGIQLKIGSLQEFIQNDGSAEDMGPNMFSVKDVHRIAILDLRIFNNDRHPGNLLVQRTPEGCKLVPIDHSFSLSDTLATAMFEWLSWPQAKVPFDQEELAFIEAIDLANDVAMLERLGVRKECLRTLKISTTLLKKGAAKGLTLYDIGTLASRLDPDEPCPLELMFEDAKEQVPNGVNDEDFLEKLWKIMDEHIDQMKNSGKN